MSATTKLKLTKEPAHAVSTDVLVVPLFEGELGKRRPDERLAPILQALGSQLKDEARRQRFHGRAGQSIAMHTHGGVKARRVVLLGLGENEPGSLSSLRGGVGETARAARMGGELTVGISLPEIKGVEPREVCGAVTEAALLGSYRFDKYQSDSKKSPRRPPLEAVTLSSGSVDTRSRKEMRLSLAIAEATNLARDLVNEPAGSLTPGELARRARSLARSHGMKCTVKGRSEIERLRMGMFRGVSLGADTEPKLITMEYRPKGRSKGKGIAFVGKGITFDSGGYNLKPHQAIDGMKLDMAGAATAIAAMRAVAAIEPPFPVTCFVGACENMVSGRAYRPGDVLESREGLTVEINNTDAEGRLVLGDVLTYASEQGFEAIVDIATLTGASMIALGPLTFGAFSNDDSLADDVLEAAASAGEDAWRLPLNQALREQLNSDVADMKNTGERAGGAITAALFLSSFVGETPWVHLDIAGPAMYSRDKGEVTKGGSGVGVRTLARLVRERS